MKRVLYLSSSGAQYWTKTGNTWQAQDSVGAGPVYLLCNLPEEGFEDIAVPRIFGADRQSFIRRQSQITLLTAIDSDFTSELR